MRADIQALRAIAVCAVVIYHLWPNGLRGGYVGVDVFFAISGFLITSHLLTEIERTGRLQSARFWARRAKRLVPASTIVLLLTTLVVVTRVPRYLWHQFLDEITASTLQVENWLLAHNSVDYLASRNTASPTQHFWTLGAEEQFYFALPILLLLAVGIAKVLRLNRRAIILVGLLVTVVSSLAYSIWLTSTTPSVAYFSTFTRAWEFGAGGLLAFAGSSSRSHRILPWIGVAAIIAACTRFTDSTPFPGAAAALPIAGAVLVMWSARGSWFDRLGRQAPVAFLGQISYAVYLWHWPLIVLVPFVTNRPLSGTDKIVIIVLTLVASWLSTVFVEDPIRFSPRLLGARRPRTVAIWAAVAIAGVLTASLTVGYEQTTRDHRLAQLAQHILQVMPRCLGAQSMDPALAPCTNPALDGLLVPDPAQAARDDANMAACWGQTDGKPNLCTIGSQHGYTKHVLAVGDSHNNALIGVYRTIAQHNNWRIDVAGRPSCYVTTGHQPAPPGSTQQECTSWRADVTAIAQQGAYDAIIVTHSDTDEPVVPAAGQSVEQATVQGLVHAWNALPNVPIIAIRDNPSVPQNLLTCVSDHPATAARDCPISRSEGLLYDGQADAAKQVPRAHVIDLTSFYCTATQCPPVIGHVVVHRDASHITATYAATLEPYIERQVVPVFGSD
ncbi:MAG: acyltransferase family protein [Jatrophihabitantaceae bacterium]